MSEKNIIVEYVCECGNVSPLSDGVNHNQGYPGGRCVTVFDHCRVKCLGCGKDMTLRVSKEEHKVEVTVIQEN